jgi:hypothetical protein
MQLRRHACSLVALLALVVGCGDSKTPQGVILKGRLVYQGKPMELVRPDIGLGMVEIQLIPAPGTKGADENSRADKDGKFEIRGPGKGIPAGTYKLAVRHWKEGMGKKDELEGRFEREKTPILIEVPAKATGGTHDLGEIELSKYDAPLKT